MKGLALSIASTLNFTEVEDIMGIAGQKDITNMQLIDKKEKIHVVEQVTDMVG